MRARRACAALVAAVTLAAASACGSAANDYRGQVKDAQSKYLGQLQPIVNQLQRDITANRYPAAARDATRASRVAGRLSAAIGKLKPPNKLKPQGQKLSGAYRGFDTALHELAVALRKHDRTAIQKALKTFNAAQRQESEAVDALNSAG